MSKVLFMLNRIPTNFNKLILLRNITINSKALINNQVKKQSSKNNSIIFSNTRRYLAQQQQQNQPQLDKNEFDKPQWERSDRYRIYYGFNYNDEAEDKMMVHVITFIFFLGFFFGPLFLIYFYPDYRTNEWCWREAQLELARREKSGEPLVNPDFIPVDRINLPSDEEIGDMEIVI